MDYSSHGEGRGGLRVTVDARMPRFSASVTAVELFAGGFRASPDCVESLA